MSTSNLGTSQRPLRAAVVGSGPSGFYAAAALLNQTDIRVRVDMFDRLPAPFGLVRYGVAPDHVKIKNVIKIYEKTAEKKGFSFWGNVHVGRDVSILELKRFFDVILFTCGAETDKHLGIPGEDLSGSHTATEFVAWYNSHPDYRTRRFDLSCDSAVIIGQGNVAVDVCRILCKTPDELKSTDIAPYALEALAQSRIKEIHMIGRRGPAQAAFTPVEIREFGNLADCDPVVDPKDLELNEASVQELADPKNAAKKKNFETLKEFSARCPGSKRKKFFLHFLKSPAELTGDSKLQKVVLEKNQLSGEPSLQKARGTGTKDELPCGILFRSIGYRGIPIAGVPFDEKRGVIPNSGGRITDGENPFPGLYAAGWIKRGPSGVIGTNKPDSEETVKHIFEDLHQIPPCPEPGPEAFSQFLKEKNIRCVTFADWKKIDAAEIQNGQPLGKIRLKFPSIDEMLAVLNR